MRFLLIMLVLFVVLGANCSCSQQATAAKKPLDIVCFGAYVDRDPRVRDVTPEVVKPLFERISSQARAIYVFNCRTDTNYILPIAHKKGVGVVAGCCLGISQKDDSVERDCLIKEIRAGNVDVAVAGDECLQSGIATEDQIIALLGQLKAAGAKKVTTSEYWKELLEHKRVGDACDVVFATIYPFHEGVAIAEALEYVKARYGDLQKAYPGKEVWVCTGWPSAGGTKGSAVASTENAACYLAEITKWASENKIRLASFEAYDEPWKSSREGDYGAHWGIWDSRGNLKPGMEQTIH